MNLRTELPRNKKLIVEGIGGMALIIIWWLITVAKLVPPGILPSPFAVLKSFKDLFIDDSLAIHMWYSIRLNTYALVEAVVLSIPVGFFIGLDPYAKAVFERYTNIIRFLPLTAVTGIFISWFGIGDMMKIQFLAFSIFIYLVPAIVLRINEVPEVYIQTVRTLGADKWQVIRYVFLHGVMSKTVDDIRIMAALSWTYVVVVELVNTNAGGVGAMSYLAARQSRMDKVFAVLIIIMAIGFIQDRVFGYLNNKLFPYRGTK